MTEQPASNRIPPAIWALTFCVFGFGTAEFVSVGLLPTIAADLSVPVSYTGLLVTMYALGIAVGGPLLTAITGSIERKKLLITALLLFVFGNLIAYFSSNIYTLLISRAITGATNGLFLAHAVVMASNMVEGNKKATAISLVFSGLMIATVVGAPAGTYLGTHFGWHATFLAIIIWTLAGLIGLIFVLPTQPKPVAALRLGDIPVVFKNTSVLIILLANIFAYTGTFVLFTYISPVLKNITGFSENLINLVLLIFGVGVALGNFAGGRLSDRKPSKTLVYLFLFHAIVLFILSFVLGSKPLVFALVLILGFLAYGNVPALQLLAVQLSEKHKPGSGGIASAVNVSAFNVGVILGSLIGGAIINSYSLNTTPWVGGVFVLIALLLGILNYRRNKTSEQ
ncbi:MFS transporter [Pseudoflavitalea sp. G-6-1-2]|uniref:MFS transporter n=1 Tax=Pseudoflavitalea sp. G-6-1-2 TaxID=2728841 RepID=UPI00146DBBDB|nr:MFS transporter [Pseudoflavitalea sp. G-6-1-2]NML19415.1 MFS transporter [Pseudoflavitalea sp. G-6-1-2]